MQADVFCRVIDNYGDIGVAWRLVRQLQREHDWHIRLWVDDLKSFQRLEPAVSLVARQDLNGIEIIDWNQATDFTPRPVVIATFSCDLPEPYVEHLRIQLNQATSAPTNKQELHFAPSLWINLEYLSAEDWVEGCHLLPSLRSDGLSSHFFFPGFTEQTGGLLRESNLIAQRDAYQADRLAQRAFLINLGFSQAAIAALFPVALSSDRARLINLFCYDNAPVTALMEALRTDPRQSVMLIPESVHPEYPSGQHGQLFIERVPFLPQTDYDKVLWTADLNFVRGEDSIVRGIWAGKPLIWQIYPQTENTHLKKLRAWLARTGLTEEICQLMMNWNPESTQCNEPFGLANLQTHSRAFTISLQEQLQRVKFEIWQHQAHRFSAEQTALFDLAGSLHAFCLVKQTT